jgi:hypothetical protein
MNYKWCIKLCYGGRARHSNSSYRNVVTPGHWYFTSKLLENQPWARNSWARVSPRTGAGRTAATKELRSTEKTGRERKGRGGRGGATSLPEQAPFRQTPEALTLPPGGTSLPPDAGGTLAGAWAWAGGGGGVGGSGEGSEMVPIRTREAPGRISTCMLESGAGLRVVSI